MQLNVHKYKRVTVVRNGNANEVPAVDENVFTTVDVSLTAVQELAMRGLTSVAVTEPNANGVRAIRFYCGNFVFPMTMTMPRRPSPYNAERTIGGPWPATQARVKRVEGEQVFLREATKEDRDAGRPYAHQENHGKQINDVIVTSADPSLEPIMLDALITITDVVADTLSGGKKPTTERKPRGSRKQAEEEALA